MTCDAFDDAVHELALGQLGEPARSTLLAHAEACGRCAAELADTMAITDRLLELAPEVEPPVGFEQRVVGTAPVAARTRARARRIAGAVLAAAAAAVIALVILLTPAGDDGRTATVLSAAGDPAGTMALEDASLVLALEGDTDWPGIWSCEVRTAEGWVEVGAWTAEDVVDGEWSVDVRDDVAREAIAMRVRSAGGDVLYTASLD